MHSPTCQKQTDRSSEQGEQDGFCEELTCNPKTRRAKRKPDGNIALTGKRPSEKEIRYVRARNQQHKADRAPKNQQRLPEFSNHLLPDRREEYAPTLIGIWIGGLELARDPFQIRRCLLDRSVRLQPSDCGEVVAAMICMGAILALLAFFACFADPTYRPAVWAVAALLAVAVLYFLLYGRKRLIAQAPEEAAALASLERLSARTKT